MRKALVCRFPFPRDHRYHFLEKSVFSAVALIFLKPQENLLLFQEFTNIYAAQKSSKNQVLCQDPPDKFHNYEFSRSRKQ